MRWVVHAKVVTDGAEIARIAQGARVIAVLGAHPDAGRPAHFVPAAMHRWGCRVLPVNPRFVGETLFGEPVRASLADLDAAVDVVDVFRRSDDVAGHLAEILAMRPPPKVVWLQSGIRDDATAAKLVAAGISVVQNRCLMVEAGA